MRVGNPILLLVLFITLSAAVFADDLYLTCAVKPDGSTVPLDPALDQCVLDLSDTTNAHAAMCDNGNAYPETLVCRTNVPGCSMICKEVDADVECTGYEQEIVRVLGTDNAHAGINASTWGNRKVCCEYNEGTFGTSNTDACGRIACRTIGTGVCDPVLETEIMRLSGATNAHIERSDSANPPTYPQAVCCDAIFQCSDGIDNDGDGFVDHQNSLIRPFGIRTDPGCFEGFDNNESDRDLVCDDTRDNDGDGRVDYKLVGGDPGCEHPFTDVDETDPLPRILQCAPDCTEVDTGICNAACEGKNGCAGILDACNGRLKGSSVATSDTEYGYCCAAPERFPSMNASNFTLVTDKDRVRSTRIRRTAAGDTIVINVYNFK